MRFLIMIYRYKGDYSAMAPDLPGCVAVDKSVEKVRKLMAEAIEFHLEGMQESGEHVPVPRKSIEFVVDESSEEAFCTWVEVKVPAPVSS